MLFSNHFNTRKNSPINAMRNKECVKTARHGVNGAGL